MKTYKTRVLALCHSPEIGGAELALASLIESTKSTYEWNLVFVGSKKAPARLTENAHSVEYIDFPWWCYEAHDKPKAIDKKVLRSRLARLKSLAQTSDLLFTNSITMPWLGLIAAQTNKPHTWYVHEFGNIDHNLQFILGYKQSLKTIEACSTRVLTISNAVKSHIGSVISLDRIDLIHQAVDLKRLLDIPVQKVNSRPIKLLCMGAIKPSKGQLLAVQATNQLNTEKPGSFTLDIIGPSAHNGYVRQLEAKQSDTIRVQVRAYDPVEVLQSHDVLLMCSENEALGRVTLEGLAAGKLVIGYACMATSEILANGRGILYKPNTPHALADAITKTSHNTSTIKKNRAYVAETFSMERQAADFDSCVHKALSSHSTLSNKHLDMYLHTLEEQSLLLSGLSGKINTTKSVIKKYTPRIVKRIVRRIVKN